jgi:integrase
MSRRRKSAVPLVVDVDGIEITASLRPQRTKAGNWEVRCRLRGEKFEKSTGTNVLEEAKRIARRIVRGEPLEVAAGGRRGLPVAEFERIQREYHETNSRPEAGERSFNEFMGIWKSFLRVYPVQRVHDVTEQMAAEYVRRLQGMSKTENRKGKKKSPKRLSIETIQKHVRHLSAAWNRVRENHPARVGGLFPDQLVQANPWQAIRNNVPKPRLEDEEDPVQFELVDNDLGRFLDQFENRPVGELFIITSLWCWGRIREMARMEWSWIQGDYVVIPRSKAKGGRGKVVRIPPDIQHRLDSIRDPSSRYVFASWVDDVKRCAAHPTRIQPFDPDRMVNQLEKLIDKFAAGIGRPEISHHALRRTAMELGEEAELRMAEKTSAEKLQTTVGNKRRNYTKRLGKKAFTLANGIYENLTIALHDFPALAKRLGCEPLEMLAEREAEAHTRRLSPLQRQRLAKRLLEGDAGGEGHGVA